MGVLWVWTNQISYIYDTNYKFNNFNEVILVVLSVVATWHAYMLNQVYLKILSGANFDEKSGKQSLNQVCKSY